MSASMNDIVDQTFECTECSEIKPVGDYYVRTDGRRNRCCKTCHNAKGKARRDADPQAYNARQRQLKRGAKSRKYSLKRKFDITPEEYEEMLQSQGGGCAACGAQPGRRALSVDHDHKTGRVRGILCDPCNFALGHAKDDPKRLLALATYLETR